MTKDGEEVNRTQRSGGVKEQGGVPTRSIKDYGTMFSFGSKREDLVHVAPDRSSIAGNPYQQYQLARRNSAPRPGEQKDPRSGSVGTKGRMFYKGKKSSTINSKGVSKSPGQRPQEGKRYSTSNGGSQRNIRTNDNMPDVSVNETSNGIEVSFPGIQSSGNALGALGNKINAMKVKPVISLKERIRERQRVYKNQFSTVVATSSNVTSTAANANNWRPKGHRIPLLGISAVDTAYADALQLLKDAPAVDERKAVQQELSMLETELSSLQQDRMWLKQGMNVSRSNAGSDSIGNKENVSGTWNTHKLLKDDATKKQPLSVSERSALQKQRGTSITIHFRNANTKEILVHNIVGEQHSAQITSLCKNDHSITTIMPANNRSVESAAMNFQHANLLSATDSKSIDSGFYVSRDVGQSQIIGKLPNRLARRFQHDEGVTTDAAERPKVEDLMYLSTGSLGCYFAKFQSGECWWGSAAEDPDFQYVMQSWDVYRVAFGPIETIQVYQPEQHPSSKNSGVRYKSLPSNSWIILSHDGRAVWKNLPSQLSKILERRMANSAAPVEVSLGPGDSYFVRFLDGSIDYSLPSKIARACERIEERGGTITNVCLHPDISHDFIIRHTELTR